MVWARSKSFQSFAEKSHVTNRKGKSSVHEDPFANFVATGKTALSHKKSQSQSFGTATSPRLSGAENLTSSSVRLRESSTGSETPRNSELQGCAIYKGDFSGLATNRNHDILSRKILIRPDSLLATIAAQGCDILGKACNLTDEGRALA
jgi:hypothetical protein